MALGKPAFQNQLSLPPSCLPKQTDPSSIPPVLSLPLISFSSLPRVFLPFLAGGQGRGESLHSSYSPPLPPSRRCAKEPRGRNLPCLRPSPTNLERAEEETVSLPIPHRIRSRASCLAVWGRSQGLERNRLPPASSPDLAAPKLQFLTVHGFLGSVLRSPVEAGRRADTHSFNFQQILRAIRARPCARHSAYTHAQNSALAEGDTD